MNIVSNGILIISGVYMALGLMYLRFWWDERSRPAYFAFTVSCISYAIYAWFELGMLRASTPSEYLANAWWSFVVGSCGITGFAWFAYLHLRGRRWLFLIYVAMRGSALVLHLLMPNGINFSQITSVGTRSILGEALSYPIPVPNPWMLLPHLSHVVLIALSLDASIRCWRRGETRTAWAIGTGTVLFATSTLIFPTLALWGLVPIPIFGSFSVLFIVIAMLYDLSHDMHRAAMLSEKLEEREGQLTDTVNQLQMAASAGNVGMWNRSIDGEIVWVSEKAAEIWGFPPETAFTQADLIDKVHPDDLERVMTCLRGIADGKPEYQIEFRMLTADGSTKWLSSQGKTDTAGSTSMVRGALVDITEAKLAEEAIRDLTGRLMNAQEKERARLARELHDGINQSVALLSIKIGMLRRNPGDLGHVKEELEQFSTAIERLSEDVHRISYELHPANLNHLGLEAALRGFCRDIGVAHEIEVHFHARGLPRELPPDVALCLYRVTQESLQNVVRHSRATSVQVDVALENDDQIRLVVADNGIGFDSDKAVKRSGLGLISIDERIQRLHGSTDVVSLVGEGTRIEVTVPLREEVLDYFPASSQRAALIH